MKKILVPCDFSAPSLEAVRFAIDIASEARGKVTLFHSIALPVMYNPSLVLAFEAQYMNDAKAAALDKLGKIKKKYSLPPTKVGVDVEFGELKFLVDRFVRKGKYDLIVMGTQGASGLKEYTVGSNAEKIVRNSSVPVIAVRKAPTRVKNIVFPVRPDLDQEKLTMKVKELQNFFGAKLHVVFINTPAIFKKDVETSAQLEKFAKRFMLKNYSLNIFGDMDEVTGIINFTKSVSGDIVAMRTHGRKGLAHIATGSIAEDVVNHINCPIWTFKVK